MTFSERMGLRPPKNLLQTDSMDDDLRVALWNVFYRLIPLSDWDYHAGLYDDLFSNIWANHLKRQLDALEEDTSEALGQFKEHFFRCEWFEVYDFIEFTAVSLDRHSSLHFIRECNAVLERELSGYRFIGRRLAPITSKEEVSTIKEAQRLTTKSYLESVSFHLQASLENLSDRTNPDYRTAVKEAISAVEALMTILSGHPKADLPRGLAILEAKGGLHKSLKTAYLSLYSYTNDSNGIRHALLDQKTLSFVEAKFFYLACVTFVNYVLGRCSELEIELRPIRMTS